MGSSFWSWYPLVCDIKGKPKGRLTILWGTSSLIEQSHPLIEVTDPMHLAKTRLLHDVLHRSHHSPELKRNADLMFLGCRVLPQRHAAREVFAASVAVTINVTDSLVFHKARASFSPEGAQMARMAGPVPARVYRRNEQLH